MAAAILLPAGFILLGAEGRFLALADDVLFLEDGLVVAHGRHDELMRDVAAYRKLIEAFEHDRAEMESELQS